jgi:hypothetical protein
MTRLFDFPLALPFRPVRTFHFKQIGRSHIPPGSMLATNKHQSRRVEHRVSSHNYFADDILPIYEGTKSGIEIGYVEEFVVRTYRIIGRTSGGSVLRSEIVTLSAVRKLEYLWRSREEGRETSTPIFSACDGGRHALPYHASHACIAQLTIGFGQFISGKIGWFRSGVREVPPYCPA